MTEIPTVKRSSPRYLVCDVFSLLQSFSVDKKKKKKHFISVHAKATEWLNMNDTFEGLA